MNPSSSLPSLADGLARLVAAGTITQTQADAVQATDLFAGLAQFAQAGAASQTDLLQTALGVRRGGNQAFIDAHARLRAALDHPTTASPE